jgi:hypothetical protein
MAQANCGKLIMPEVKTEQRVTRKTRRLVISIWLVIPEPSEEEAAVAGLILLCGAILHRRESARLRISRSRLNREYCDKSMRQLNNAVRLPGPSLLLQLRKPSMFYYRK